MQKKQAEQAELDKAFEDFNNDTPLNLTNQEKKQDQVDDPESAAKLQAEYQKFMNEMKNGSLEGDQNFDGLADVLGGLMKNFGDLGLGKDGEQFKNVFNGAGNGGQGIEDIASKLLEMFMKKELLYEPLQESRKNYEQYFKKQEGKIPAAELARFNKQYDTIREIIKILDENPDDKQKLMDLFEQMQDYGEPPVGIASVSPGF